MAHSSCGFIIRPWSACLFTAHTDCARAPSQRFLAFLSKKLPATATHTKCPTAILLYRRHSSDRTPRARVAQEEIAVVATSLNVNGRTVSVTIEDPDTPLLYVLRNEFGLHVTALRLRSRRIRPARC